MKNIAKILCFVLSLVLIISVMGVSAFAADETAVAEVDGVYYTSITDALKAVKENSVVNILDDITITENWDNRYTGAKISVPVTINGNGHTLKFTSTVDDKNYFSVFRFEAAATVQNLTFDFSETVGTLNRVRAISAKLDLTVDNCSFIGNPEITNARAIIFGEGAGAALSKVKISVTNSDFSDFRRAISDNENAQDANTVVVSGNECTNASIYVSASKQVTLTDNVMDGGYVNIKSYASKNNLTVVAENNTLETEVDGGNVIDALYVQADEGFDVAPKGSLNHAYVSGNTIWGECGGNAKESFEIRVYSGDEYLGSTSLNNVDGIIDGSVYVTWSINIANQSSDWWTVDWTIFPKEDVLPDRVEQWVDGVLVAEAPVQYNGPDNLNKIVAATVDENGNIISFYHKLADAMANTVDGRVLLLADVKENIDSFADIYLYTLLENGVTVTSTYTGNYVDFDNVTVGYGVTLNVNNLYSGGSNNSIDGTVNVSGDYKLGYEAVTSIFGTLTVGGELNMADNTDEYTINLNVYGTLTCGTLNLTSGNIYGYWATVTLENLVADVLGNANISLEESVVTITGSINVHEDLDFKVLDNGDGTYNIVAKQYVAQVGDKKYESLQDAIKAAGDGETIVIVNDFELSTSIALPSDKAVVIDLNGWTITGTDNATASFALFNGVNSNLTINDSSDWGGGRITLEATNNRGWGAYSAIFNNRGGVLTINGGSFEHFGGTDMAYIVDNNANSYGDAHLSINGGSLVSSYIAIRMYMSSDHASGTSFVEINDGYIAGIRRAIWGQAPDGGLGQSAELTINGGEFDAPAGSPAIEIACTDKAFVDVVINGGTFNGSIVMEADELVISNGTFNCELSLKDESGIVAASSSSIKGGSFVTDVNAYCVEGLKSLRLSDGTYGIVTTKDTPHIGDNGNWFIGDIDTGYLATTDITIVDGYWVINGLPTDIRAEAIDGHCPKLSIGDDGFWYIDDVKTEVRAQAYDGKGIQNIEWDKEHSHDNIMKYVITFTDGTTYDLYVYNGANGNQGPTGMPGEVGDKGEKGDQGAPGQDGEDASGIVVVVVAIAAVSLLIAVAFVVFRKNNPFLFH